jgi:hypothetical protein
MNLIEVVSEFRTEADCLDSLELVRWPNGLCCIKCGEMNVYKFTTNATTRKRTNKKGETRTVVVPSRRLYECKAPKCGYQFSATTGTVFHDSHLSLIKWFMAVGLIVEAKKGMSALQVARHLNLENSYKTVWYLCHRIRKAMKDGGLLTGIVEVDETYLTPKKPRKGKPYVKKEKRDVVLGMIERGGKLRLVPMTDSKMETIEPIMDAHISPDATLQTDESPVYHIIGKRRFPGRHPQSITAFAMASAIFTPIQLRMHSRYSSGACTGTFDKVSIKHLGRHCEEFSFRFNRRESQKHLFDATLKGLVKESNLPFKTLIASE